MENSRPWEGSELDWLDEEQWEEISSLSFDPPLATDHSKSELIMKN